MIQRKRADPAEHMPKWAGIEPGPVLPVTSSKRARKICPRIPVFLGMTPCMSHHSSAPCPEAGAARRGGLVTV